MIDEKSSAYRHLKHFFSGDLILPSHRDYRDALKRWSKLAERPAALVAFPRGEQDVASVIRYAVEQGLEIAVKGEQCIVTSRYHIDY